jgi:acetate kinase
VRRARGGDTACARALDAFFYRLHHCLGAYVGLLGGLDVLAIGGGVSEHVPEVRERLMQGLAWLGCQVTPPIEADENDLVTVLSRPSSKVLALLVFVDEERVMAEQAVTYLRTREVSSRT